MGANARKRRESTGTGRVVRGEEVRVQEVVSQRKEGTRYGSSLPRWLREEGRETLRPEIWDSGRGLLQFNITVTQKTVKWYTGTL